MWEPTVALADTGSDGFKYAPRRLNGSEEPDHVSVCYSLVLVDVHLKVATLDVHLVSVTPI